MYQKLSLESLQSYFYEIYDKKAPGYLTEIILTRSEAYQTRNVANVSSIFLSFKHDLFKNTFFPSAILEWNNLNPSRRNSANYNVLKTSILKFIRLSPLRPFIRSYLLACLLACLLAYLQHFSVVARPIQHSLFSNGHFSLK